MNNETSEFITHKACPSCPSSDALAVYSDGHEYCFSCGYTKFSDTESPTQQHSKTTTNGNSRITYEGEFARLTSRNISEETCKKFNVRVDHPGPVIRFPYFTTSRHISSYKEKTKEKDFYWKGKNVDKTLFGQHLFGSGKTLVISEGELDCLSIWEARKNWPVMSISNGAKGAYKNLSAQLPALLKFEEIILSLITIQLDKKPLKNVLLYFQLIVFL